MRILLLNPPFIPRYSRSSRSSCVAKGGTFYYPYYLAYATGALEKHGFSKVKLVDAVANDWNHEETIKFVKSYGPDLVVIDTSTPSIYNDVGIATEIKKCLQTHISLVGTHPTNVTGGTFGLSDAVDSICRGEYDYTVVDLARSLEENHSLRGIGGLSFREDGVVTHNGPRPLIKNLDELPFVSEVYKKHFGKEGIKKYFYASLRFPMCTILTARGCPFNCSFCPVPFKNSYRARSVENVVEEFQYIQRELPHVREIMLEDDTFSVNKKRTIKLCDLLIKRGVKIPWSANARVDTDLETLQRMRDANCRLLCVGFESSSKKSLDVVNKRIDVEMQMEFMRNANKVGILINGCFILGLPSDTKKRIRRTIEFAKELNPDTAQFYPIFVYPNTRVYTQMKDCGYLATEDYSKWLTPEGLHNCVVDRPNLKGSELVEMCNKARKEFYLRPSYIVRKFWQGVRHPEEMSRTLKSARTFFKHLR